jgi:hypothetical protein
VVKIEGLVMTGGMGRTGVRVLTEGYKTLLSKSIYAVLPIEDRVVKEEGIGKGGYRRTGGR